MDYSPPGSSAHGILQARTLEWVAISSSRGSSRPRDRTRLLSRLLHCQAGPSPLALPSSGRPSSRPCERVSRSVVSDSLRPLRLWPARLLCPWDFPGKNTGVGSYILLQVIFLTQGRSPALQADSLPSEPAREPPALTW